MTDLTEQYQKGELPSRDDGHCWLAYYIKHKDGYIHADSLWRGQWGTADRNSIEEILAKVPSYEEWQKLKEFADYSIHNRDELTRQINFWMQENTKLKELLKECELWFTGVVGNMNNKNVGEHNRKLPIGNFEHAFKVFSQKINQVLGEDK